MNKATLALLSCLGLGAAGCNAEAPPEPAAVTQAVTGGGGIQHAILISLDGFHNFDLTRYVAGHPHSAMARMMKHGVNYANAYTSKPSDSYPGSLALTTGGSPITTGIVYDNSWDDTLSPPGSNCATVGTEVLYDESVNTGNGDTWTPSIDPTLLPLDPANGCTPVFPHQYLQANTIFNVAQAAGRVTAYADKHPTYEIYNGPNGPNAADLYLTESSAFNSDFDPPLINTNDDMKVQAMINWIDGYNHDRSARIGVPAIFGMNFQAPNVYQKNYGYASGDGTPTANLEAGFDFVDSELGKILDEMDAQGITRSTLFVLAAKHGNAPVDPSLKRTTDDGPYGDIVASVGASIANLTDDDEAIIWLTDHSKANAVAAALRKNIAQVGGGTVYVGSGLDTLLGGRMEANRRPDVIVDSTNGVIYSSHPQKLLEHGGFHEQDRHVALLVSNPAFAASTVTGQVSNQQVAPTILNALGLDAHQLQAVQIENVSPLPGLGCISN